MDLAGEKLEMDHRRELVRFGRWLYRLGFVSGTSGNLSLRLDRQRLLATPSGFSKYLLRPSDMVVVDMEGRELASSRRVTSEIGMHLAIYRERPDICAVIHSHPPFATAFACTGRALDEVICQEAIMSVGCVPLAAYATTGTTEVAASLQPFLAGHDAILMANHGAVTYGRTLLDAFMKTETVEHLANVHCIAHQLGSAQTLRKDQQEQVLYAKTRYGQNGI